MTELLSFLKELVSAPGLSGHEQPVRAIIARVWEPLADELKTSRLGSLHALHRGTAPEPRPSLLIAAHMDAIGLMVTALEGEFLRLAEVGGLDDRVLPGQLVTVHGREPLPGVVVQPPPHLLPADLGSGPVPLENLLVDVGLSARQVASKVRIGDLISFAQPPLELGDETVAGHSLDNRASVAALTHCLQELQNRPHAWDVWVVATVQEEETFGGAYTSTYQLQPDLAVAVDVTFAKTHDSGSHKTVPMGKGPALGWGPNIHPGLFKAFQDVADRLEIPYNKEVMAGHSGTDAYAMQVTAAGVPTMVVSIPLRYMHTPVEMVTMKDITRTGRLLAEFAAGLEPGFMQELRWED